MKRPPNMFGGGVVRGAAGGCPNALLGEALLAGADAGAAAFCSFAVVPPPTAPAATAAAAAAGTMAGRGGGRGPG
ncbi:hypothetical protein, partial [Ralstonia solanacearum]|uniref:hypothetical protein n=1 Tax=Ralstonia solanacearum TaxID=305 RepID=UPI001E65B8BC